MTIGEKIKTARRAAGLTQRALAEKCGIATGTVQQYELDKRRPRIEQLGKISVALGVPIECLLDVDVITTVPLDNVEITPEMLRLFYHPESKAPKLLTAFVQLNDNGQQEAVKRVEELTEVPRFQKKIKE